MTSRNHELAVLPRFMRRSELSELVVDATGDMARGGEEEEAAWGGTAAEASLIASCNERAFAPWGPSNVA